jgi:hypothetical protein
MAEAKESLPVSIRRRLEAGEAVAQTDYPGVNPHTWQGALSRLKDPKRCGTGKLPLTLVYDKAAKAYSLYKAPVAA